MPRMEDNVDFLKDAENAVDMEQDALRPTREDEGMHGTLDADRKDCSSNVGENSNCYSRPGDTRREIPDTRNTNQTLSYSSCRRRKTSPVQINTTGCNTSLCTTEPRSLPSPLPSHFTNQDELLQQEPRRKTIAFLSSSNRSLEQKPGGCGNIKYTSLKSEIRKRSKTEQASKNVNGLGLVTLNRRETVSNPEEKEKTLKKDEKHLSAFGIHEEVFECCLGDWIVTDLDLNVYEMKQAQDVTYLREKRKQKSFSIFGLYNYCWIM